MPQEIPTRLSRQLKTADAIAIGVSAMIGSGIFVASGIATASAGAGVLLGLMIAAGVAYCNATSSAQLASAYPESGGTYIYGRKLLGPFWGWLAGWAFVVGKLASCAAAALTFGFYVNPSYAHLLGFFAVAGLTLVNYFGIKKTSAATWVLLTLVLFALAATVLACFFGGKADWNHLKPNWENIGIMGILQSAAIMFFAFAGYARVATLGEEVVEPRRTIPKAIVGALTMTLIIYLAVTASVLLAIGPQKMAQSSAPLAVAVSAGNLSMLTPIVRLGAIVATLGVLLSLMVGISRTVFAMASNRELPSWLAAVHPRYQVPHRAEVIVAMLIGSIVLLADVRSAIGFSAFTILIYYAVTHVCAVLLSAHLRLWPRWLAVIGLISCLLLAFSLPHQSLIVGGGIILLGAISYFVKTIYG